MLEYAEALTGEKCETGRKAKEIILCRYEEITQNSDEKDNNMNYNVSFKKGTGKPAVIDPVGLRSKNLPSAQKRAWRNGWICSHQHSPQDFVDKIYELALFRRRRGAQNTEYLGGDVKTKNLSTDLRLCQFKYMKGQVNL